MRFFYHIKIAFAVLANNKWRSVLTSSGSIFGVISLLTLFSITAGLSETVESGLKDFGLDLVTVRSENNDNLNQKSLILDDAYALEERAGHIDYASPIITISATYIYDGVISQTPLRGIDHNYDDINKDLEIESGKFFTELQVRSNRQKIILGSQLAKSLFENVDDAVGKIIKVNANQYEVAAVLKEIRDDSIINRDEFNTYGFVPITSLMADSGIDKVDSIIVRVSSQRRVKDASNEIEAILRERHEKKDFDILTQSEIFASINSLKNNLRLLTLVILVVTSIMGGSSIMNVVLLSVSERKKEIGIRKALGATEGDIFWQFIIEGLVISFLGAIVGFAVGGLLLVFIKIIVNLPVKTTYITILFSLGYALLIGAVFAVLPAIRASRAAPIENLKEM